ncbi:MAG: phenylacetate--CoA ligase family protein [Planctomycetota bacterium]
MKSPLSAEIDPWRLPTGALRTLQLDRLNALLTASRTHPFYRDRLASLKLPLNDLSELCQLPLLRKSEMVAEAPGAPARLFAEKRSSYRYFHQTSGTSGRPMPVLDTDADWEWWMRCWGHVLRAAHVRQDDVAMMAFSFGPFIGFWTACDALRREGALVIPGGGLSSEARVQMIVEQQCSIVCCTPTYALHLLDVASKMGVDLAESNVARLIVAGEPGGSLPSVRKRIESGYDATVVDHSGGSEIGAWGFGSRDGTALHVIESEFVAECLVFDNQTPDGRAAEPDEPSELILTGLGRFGGPAIRYRTGDIVKPSYEHADPDCGFLRLEGGVVGRMDDMVVIRGVNIFPSSIEAIVREIDPHAEFQMIVHRLGEMDSMRVAIELPSDTCERLASLLQSRLALRIPVDDVPPGSLPRFSAKSRRLVRQDQPE